jgi:hypothetical protein
MIFYSEGYRKSENLIKIMKETGKIEFTENEIRFLIAKHIGYSKLSQERYLNALIVFGFIKKLENGSYGII